MDLCETIVKVRKHIRDGADRANEQNTKNWCILPILQTLGWAGPERLTSEGPLGQEGVRPDYALLGPQREPLALIEAKTLQRKLNDKDVKQVLDYCDRLDQVYLCALTNGAQWWLYLPREGGDPVEKCFSALDLQEDDIGSLVTVFESCLGYEAVNTWAAHDRAADLLEEMAMEQSLREAVKQAVDDIVSLRNQRVDSLVQDVVEGSIGWRPSDEKIYELMASLRRHASTNSSRELTQGQSNDPLLPWSTPVRLYAKRANTSGSVVYTLFGTPYEEDYQHMATRVAQSLYARHPDAFGGKSALPASVSRFIKVDPYCEFTEFLDGVGDVWQEYCGGDCYILLPYDGETCKVLAYNLLGALGYSEAELRIYES